MGVPVMTVMTKTTNGKWNDWYSAVEGTGVRASREGDILSVEISLNDFLGDKISKIKKMKIGMDGPKNPLSPMFKSKRVCTVALMMLSAEWAGFMCKDHNDLKSTTDSLLKCVKSSIQENFDPQYWAPPADLVAKRSGM
jgi:hypothetical protein